MLAVLAVWAVLVFLPTGVLSADAHALHPSDPLSPVVLAATVILFFALIGRFLSLTFGQPPVLGELFVGVALGNLASFFDYELVMLLREGPQLFDTINLVFDGMSVEQAAQHALEDGVVNPAWALIVGPNGAELMQVAHVVDVFARYGVLFLLFYVGLDTSLRELREVGTESAAVAVSGVVAPFGLGLLAMSFLVPDVAWNAHLFVAATLAATSVGITAAVIEELGRQHSHEARVILGAAVIDDVLALILLAIIASMIQSGSLAFGDALAVIFQALAFLVGVVAVGPAVLRTFISAASKLEIMEAKLFVSIIFAMSAAWVADLVGLAPIVGAFAGGVVLSDRYFEKWEGSDRKHYQLKDLIFPLETMLVPFFFVLMGIQVKLERFMDWHVIRMALILLAVAIAGKLVTALFVRRGTRRWTVGIGMVPRGEVGLVFAAVGQSLGVIDGTMFSAIVLMVIVTTLIVPPLLKWSFR